MRAAFVSYDGADPNNPNDVRAEVYVQKGTGLIDKMSPSKGGKSVQVSFDVEGLKYPVYGWIGAEDPIFPLVKEAFESRTPVEYRIESQRKNGVDRTRPMSELRENTTIANETTKVLLVGINGKLSEERLTHPAEDPAPAGRQPAAAPVQEAPQSPAPVQHSSYSNNYPASNDREAAPYVEFNNDGSRNYGSYAITAASSAENLVRHVFAERGVEAQEEDIYKYAAIVLAVVDKIQAYFTRKPADRMANSHTRIRAVAYDAIENTHPIPDSPAKDAEWVAALGKTTLTRFTAISRIASEPFDLATLNAAKNDQKVAQAQPERQQPAPQAQAQPERQQKPAAEQTPAAGNNVDDALSVLGATSSGGIDMFPKTDLNTIADRTPASEESIEVFKELVLGTDTKDTYRQLLKFTFGVQSASELPEEVLSEFIDFYTADEDNFKRVVEYVNTIS